MLFKTDRRGTEAAAVCFSFFIDNYYLANTLAIRVNDPNSR